MNRRGGPQPGQLALFDVSDVAPPTESPLAAESEPETEPLRAPVEALPTAGTATVPARAVAEATPRDRRRQAPPRRLVTPRVPPSPHVTLDQAIPDYLTALAAQGRSQHTLKSFELDLRLLRGQLGNRAVGAIELGHLRQFIAWVRLTRDNAPNSLRRKVATLKNFFGYLCDEGYLVTSPADALPYPEAYVALPEFLEDDAAERLVAATEGNPFWRALIVLMLDTGLKRDEVLALRVADLHLDPDSSEGSYLVVRETDAAKRLRSRRLPVPPRLREALEEYFRAVPRVGGESRVFDISVRGINFIVETCGARAGVVTSKPRLTPQVLRETFAVAQMRLRVREERRRQAEGLNAEALQFLALQHDAEVLELLGLKDDPDTARKYRQLVKA